MVLSLQKFRYMYYLQWDSTRKAPTAMGGLYYGGIGRDYGTIFINMVVQFVATQYPTREGWFGRFTKRGKFIIEILRNKNFGISILTTLTL